MGTAAAVLPSFGYPKYSCRNGGDVQVCSGCKRHLGFNTSRCHLHPKPCPCHASQRAGSTIGLCPALGKDSLLCTTGLEEALWVENSIFRHCHSMLKMDQCFVCAVTPVRSLLHTLAPEVEEGFWKTAVERLGRSRRRAQGEVLITAMPLPGKGQK